MALATTITDWTYWGDKKVVYGKGVLSGTTNTGDVATGLKRVGAFFLVQKATAQKGVAVNEDFPLAGGDVTIYTEDNDATFYWFAIGDPV